MLNNRLSKYFLKGLTHAAYTATFIMLFAFSCKSPSKNQEFTNDTTDHTEGLIRNQQNIIRDESVEIDDYIKRRDYKMLSTETGLRYMIYKKGPELKPISDNSKVRLNYSVSLLDGTTIYHSDSSGVLDLIVGKSEVASGLQEGLKLMHEGDNAVFIIPSHLAYGLTGDGDKIKQYQVLVVDVNVLKVFE